MEVRRFLSPNRHQYKMKRRYIPPIVKRHGIGLSSFLNSSPNTPQYNGKATYFSKSTEDAASRLGSPIWDEEEAEEDETGY